MTGLPPVFAPVAARVGDAAATQMARHWALVCEAQQRQNLTGIKDVQVAVWLHYMDALAALPLWPADASLLDIGSGAGFPGLVLAMARPHAHVMLLEPRRLRAEFLRHVVATLGLHNVSVVAGRLQTQAPKRFGCVSMRAVFARNEQLAGVLPWLLPAGRLLVFRSGQADLGPPPRRLQQIDRVPYVVQGAIGERRIDVWQPVVRR